MGSQGFFSKEGELLSRRDLALLPKGTVVRCHVHAQHTDPAISRMARAAEKHQGKANILPQRTARFSNGMIVPPQEHDDMFIATDYMVTITSDPLPIRTHFGVLKPDFHGGRRKKQAPVITWLKAPTEKPRASTTRSLRRLKRIDWFK